MSKRVFREFLSHLQSSSAGKKNYEGIDRAPQDMAIDGKPLEPEQKFDEMEICVKETFSIAKINHFAEEFAPELNENNLKKMSERQTPNLSELLDENQQNQPPATLEKMNPIAVLTDERTRHLINQFEQLVNAFETFVDNHHLPSAE